jgi:peptidoglycan/xylan/chitin deacetylase (PgdA/CDA1 family)
VKTLRVRDDDVFIRPNFQKFKETHETILAFPSVLHVCAIVCDSVWADGILDYIRHQQVAGNIEIQLHGWSHIDYAPLSKDQLREHMKMSMDWLHDNFWVTPTIWYTPWGAHTLLMDEVAAEYRLKLVDCSNILQTHRLLEALRNKHREAYIKQFRAHGEIFCHYWESKTRKPLREVLEALA